MSLTREQIKSELEECGARTDNSNVDAGMRLTKTFHAEDCATFADAKKQMIEILDLFLDELEYEDFQDCEVN